ncbi:hypothetical protein [Crateriforma conspicua]|uniref:Uncharacterized protein n=1 Tax=Crateriforma conspicua TaxID=2527996 RepID=A0A5C5Y7F8_9PLAN|nr:hypothetical protein [Crateriforma conspicua]QDV65850.1 hypothetical protein Mal65_50230 [Crateriforma conspicua]TWT71250.1 hypothetical protein Pan14r_35600 [Crateriforma conspicua]
MTKNNTESKFAFALQRIAKATVLACALAGTFTVVGCGPDNSTTVSGVDDSALRSEEDLADMEAQYESDAGSH